MPSVSVRNRRQLCQVCHTAERGGKNKLHCCAHSLKVSAVLVMVIAFSAKDYRHCITHAIADESSHWYIVGSVQHDKRKQDICSERYSL